MPHSDRGVLMIIADDWSPVAGCYGNPVIRTPAIDALAGQGCVFEQAFCVSPSCAASRANLLTGLYPHTHGQYGHSHSPHGFRTHDHVRSLPAILRDAGVRCGLVGKSHTAPEQVYPWHTSERTDMVSAAALSRTAADFLQEAGTQPFYLMFAPAYPHRTGAAGWGLERHTAEFSDPRYDEAEVIVPPWLPDLPEVRRDLAGYYGAVSRYDHCVGQALETLRRSGREQETLVLVLTDHGMPFPGGKASPFEAGHHCPLIVSAPGGHKGVRSDALVNWCDLLPTVCDWLGVPPPEDIPGRSILPLLDGRGHEGWDQTFYAHCFHEVTNYYPYRVLRGRRYKYVRSLAAEMTMPLPSDLFRSPTHQATLAAGIDQSWRRRPFEALYDLEKDPLERVNLIDDPLLRDTAAPMRQSVQQWRRATRDPWLEVDFQREAEQRARQAATVSV